MTKRLCFGIALGAILAVAGERALHAESADNARMRSAGQSVTTVYIDSCRKKPTSPPKGSSIPRDGTAAELKEIGSRIQIKTEGQQTTSTIGEPTVTEFIIDDKAAAPPDTKGKPVAAATMSTKNQAVVAPLPEVYLPAAHATHGLKLRVAAVDDTTLLQVAAYGNDGAGEVLCFASEAASSRQELLVPAWFRGAVRVSREDIGTGKAKFSITLASEVFQQVEQNDKAPRWFIRNAAEGNAMRKGITESGYDTLVRYAKCDYLSRAERMNGCVAKNKEAAAQVYTFVSEAIGRNPKSEFDGKGKLTHASHSEPMIVFFGIAGLNKVLLLDCRNAGSEECEGAHYAEPWQTSLEQADYVWIAYLEDNLSPFDTAMDIEYRRRTPDVDYDEFDPTTQASMRKLMADTPSQPAAAAGQESAAAPPLQGHRVLRVAAKRLRMRDAPTAVIAGFTRRGPNYGLRQWQRGYVKTSAHWWAFAATVMVAAKPMRPQTVDIRPEPPADLATPQLGRLGFDEGQGWVYSALSIRLPGIRARAMDQPNSFQRLMWNLIPDYSFGMSPPRGENPLITALSWPMLSERMSFFIGYGYVRQPVFRTGYAEAQLVPLSTDPAAIVDRRWTKDLLFGVSFDLVRTK